MLTIEFVIHVRRQAGMKNEVGDLNPAPSKFEEKLPSESTASRRHLR